MEDKNNIIEIKNLNFLYNNQKVLKNINLNFERGKFYTILGPNGSGKTTLIRSISKNLEIEDNTIFVNGKDINKISSKTLAQKIAIVPQHTYIEFDFSVEDIILMGRSPYISRFQSENTKDIDIAEKAMKLTNTYKLKDKNINSLSGGECQRTIIARSICQNTNIMLLDEPISHLDIYYQIQLLNTIKDLNKEKQVTIISVLHDLNLAAAYSDHIILMKDGQVYCQGIAQNIFKKDILKKVYGINVEIINNPINDIPYIIPVTYL